MKSKSKFVKVPTTYLIKGKAKDVLSQLPSDLVTKSCSGMRSIAATNDQFKDWSLNNLQNIPTLFQQRIDGVDQRVHLLDDFIWSLEVISKDCIDYRYSSRNSVEYSTTELPDVLVEYCKNLARIENNRFVGVDFIRKGETYYGLECNPGPGWSTFRHHSRKKFAQAFIKTLHMKKGKTHE